MKPTNLKDLIKFRASPVLRRAIRLRAALQDVDLQDVIVEALKNALAEEIAEVERRGLIPEAKPAVETEKKAVKRSGRGTK
jgi:hypothetical protein